MPEDIILYRGITPGAIGFDVHGGYGETWTTDPELGGCLCQRRRWIRNASLFTCVGKEACDCYTYR